MQFTSRLRDGLVGAWCPSVSGWGGNLLRDLSGYGNHGTLTNMDPATDWVVSGGKQALDFDGSDDYLITQQSGAIPRQGPFSCGMWVRTPSVTPASNVSFIAHGQFSGWKILLFPGNSAIRVNRNGVANFDVNWGVLSGLNDTFFHLAVTYDTAWKMFVNGTVVGTTTGGYATVTGSFPEIGRSLGGAEAGQMLGQLDDVRIYNRTLSDQEIRTLYTGGPGVGLRPERKRRYVSSTGNRRRRLICGANC